MALIASLARWWLQGSHNLYTAVAKRFYVADPDLGWRVGTDHPIWLGLEVCAVILAIAIGLALTGRWWRKTKVTRGLAWLAAGVTLVVPIAAFATGGRGGRDDLPIEAQRSFVAEQIVAGLDAPAGRYEVVAHDGTAVTARISAGGEGFDARFADVTGFWRGDPHALDEPIQAELSVAAASVDTGVRDRSRHARTGYLKADAFPRITVTLDRMLAAQAAGPDEVAFRAHGTLGLIGRVHPIEVTGTVKRADAAALGRLGLAGSVLIVRAEFSIAILDTALAKNAGDFTGARIPISISLVLRKTP